MKQYIKNLGKVSLSLGGAWSLDKEYDILTLVHEEHTDHGYISKRDVPVGVDINNRDFWMPLNASGYADNNIIILGQKTGEHTIKQYSLEEAVNSIAPVGRKPGLVLGFYNDNRERLDAGGRWEIWQYNGTDVADWENLNNWDNVYYNYNKFVGWYHNEIQLRNHHRYPEVGCYAYVGEDFKTGTVYKCDSKYIWFNTNQPIWEYIHIVIDGTITVGENGNWFSNGVDTGIAAAKTPIFRLSDDGYVEYSFEGDDLWRKLFNLNNITPTVEVTHKVIDVEEAPSVVNKGDNFNLELEFNIPDAISIKVGKTETSDFGGTAEVKNSGTPKKPVLDFVIPRGVQGAPGPKGSGFSVNGWVDTVNDLPPEGNIGDAYMVGTTAPYAVYMYKDNVSKFVNIGSALEVNSSIIDGGRADTLYGGAREINCGGADAHLT